MTVFGARAGSDRAAGGPIVLLYGPSGSATLTLMGIDRLPTSREGPECSQPCNQGDQEAHDTDNCRNRSIAVIRDGVCDIGEQDQESKQEHRYQ